MIFEEADIKSITKRVILDLEKKYILIPRSTDEIKANGNDIYYILKTIDFVCLHHSVHKELLLSTSKRGDLIEFRQMIAYLVRKYSDERISLDTIGKVLGDRTHATIINAIKQLNNLMETDLVFHDKIIELEKIFVAKIGNFEI